MVARLYVDCLVSKLMKINNFGGFMCRLFLLLSLLLGFQQTAFAAPESNELKVLSFSKDYGLYKVIVGDVELKRWVVCWGLNKDGVPVDKGSSYVKGKFVQVYIRTEKVNDISSFYCEYEER